MTRRRANGFTLVEVLLALSIGAALLVVVFGAVRAGLAAWGRGEARAMALEHDRSLDQLLRRAVAGAFPYRGGPIKGGTSGVLFDGRPDSLTLVTASPPIPAPLPVAFTAVHVSRDERGLVVRQLALPSAEPVERVAAVVTDSAVLALRFRYLGEEADAWIDRWDMGKEDGLPRAVEIRLITTTGARVVDQPPVVVPIRALTP
ncbi:MAG TPA: prepilin-type N-terminal cleavage/methylation domain-containing protein [Methylomirabilota bacterium]|nr:prepilin-type N-terminal cleavage/methylation domain-containing protein [Methylomirabilota bacterium]